MMKKSAALVALLILASLTVTGCTVQITNNRSPQTEGGLNETLNAGAFSLSLKNLTLNTTDGDNQTEASVILKIRNSGGKLGEARLPLTRAHTDSITVQTLTAVTSNGQTAAFHYGGDIAGPIKTTLPHGYWAPYRYVATIPGDASLRAIVANVVTAGHEQTLTWNI
jgi:hypothetical protein